MLKPCQNSGGRQWFLTAETPVQSEVTSGEICDGRSDTGGVTSPFFGFPLCWSTLICHRPTGCAVALTKQHITVPAARKLASSSLTIRLVGFGIRLLLACWACACVAIGLNRVGVPCFSLLATVNVSQTVVAGFPFPLGETLSLQQAHRFCRH
jgi:hypothetical protein